MVEVAEQEGVEVCLLEEGEVIRAMVSLMKTKKMMIKMIKGKKANVKKMMTKIDSTY